MIELGIAHELDGDGDGWSYPDMLNDSPATMEVNSDVMMDSKGFKDLIKKYDLKRASSTHYTKLSSSDQEPELILETVKCANGHIYEEYDDVGDYTCPECGDKSAFAMSKPKTAEQRETDLARKLGKLEGAVDFEIRHIRYLLKRYGDLGANTQPIEKSLAILEKTLREVKG